MLGSAQVRMEYKGEVWVASGDYKVEPDATCAEFDPIVASAIRAFKVRCVFVSSGGQSGPERQGDANGIVPRQQCPRCPLLFDSRFLFHRLQIGLVAER